MINVLQLGNQKNNLRKQRNMALSLELTHKTPSEINRSWYQIRLLNPKGQWLMMLGLGLTVNLAFPNTTLPCYTKWLLELFFSMFLMWTFLEFTSLSINIHPWFIVSRWGLWQCDKRFIYCHSSWKWMLQHWLVVCCVIFNLAFDDGLSISGYWSTD